MISSLAAAGCCCCLLLDPVFKKIGKRPVAQQVVKRRFYGLASSSRAELVTFLLWQLLTFDIHPYIHIHIHS
jgi:hypothetical protein